ncbi:transcription factor [Pseudozyma hubeiensis SY62]|uniref:Transcription factor n=1 Tax=Pseudozyma hubeiensis (strain SY62) TaxID=1305764 RepID=R9P3B1_PSEHS|nr:transcription factor [Pseudozyma hubeiensis SY62]GAC95784.1 transcription factor [Pseudozyma hubeiensis SY62]
MRAGMMVGMEPPRPNTSLGVTPSAPVPGNSQASSGTNTVNANRRVAHLLSEQKRRESINTGFEDLRQAIPACRDGQDSKATILKRALEYIRELEGVVERHHRLPAEGHALGGYSNRSPPDDKDDLRRFGRHGDDARRGLGGARQMTGGSNSSSGSNETGAVPRIGGLPSNAYGSTASVDFSATSPGLYYTGEYRSYGPSRFPAVATDGAAAEISRGAINASNDVRSAPSKRYLDDSDEDQRLPSRRRVSDGDKDDVQSSPPRPNYTMTRPAPHSRSPMMRSPPIEKPRDWHARLENKSLVDSAVRA